MADSESYAVAWEKWFDIVEAGANPLNQRMIDLADIKADATVLDVGTGIGEPALSVAKRQGFQGRITAIDPDALMVDIGRKRVQQCGISNIEFIHSDIESMPLEATSFDTVLARWSLMFVDDFSNVLNKLKPVIRPGGRLVAATWAPPDVVPALTIAKMTAHRHLGLTTPEYGPGSAFSLSDSRALEVALSSAGFVDVASEQFPVRYRYDSVEQYIQNRIDQTGPLWENMATDSEHNRQGAFAAIDDALSKFRLPQGGLEIENIAICVSGRIA